MTESTSAQRPAARSHGKMLLRVLRHDSAAPLDAEDAAALCHVLGCARCLLDLLGFWGLDGACALVRPQLQAYVAGTLSAELASAVATHLAGCSQCPPLLAEARAAAYLAAQPPAARAAGELALALLNAALLRRSGARALLLDWLGRGISYSEVLQRAAGLSDLLVEQALAAAVAAGVTAAAPAARSALALLREHGDSLAELDLRVQGDRLSAGDLPPLGWTQTWVPRANAVAADKTAPPAQAQFDAPGDPLLIVLYDDDEATLLARVVITDPAAWRAAGAPRLALVAADPPPADLPWQSWLTTPGQLDLLIEPGEISVDIALTHSGRKLDKNAQNTGILWTMQSLTLRQSSAS